MTDNQLESVIEQRHLLLPVLKAKVSSITLILTNYNHVYKL